MRFSKRKMVAAANKRLPTEVTFTLSAAEMDAPGEVLDQLIIEKAGLLRPGKRDVSWWRDDIREPGAVCVNVRSLQ